MDGTHILGWDVLKYLYKDMDMDYIRKCKTNVHLMACNHLYRSFKKDSCCGGLSLT